MTPGPWWSCQLALHKMNRTPLSRPEMNVSLLSQEWPKISNKMENIQNTIRWGRGGGRTIECSILDPPPQRKVGIITQQTVFSIERKTPTWTATHPCFA